MHSLFGSYLSEGTSISLFPLSLSLSLAIFLPLFLPLPLTLSFSLYLSLATFLSPFLRYAQYGATSQRAVSWAGPTILVTNHSRENRVLEILDWSRLSLKRRRLAPFHRGTILTSGSSARNRLSHSLSHLHTLTHILNYARAHTHTLSLSLTLNCLWKREIKNKLPIRLLHESDSRSLSQSSEN